MPRGTSADERVSDVAPERPDRSLSPKRVRRTRGTPRLHRRRDARLDEPAQPQRACQSNQHSAGTGSDTSSARPRLGRSPIPHLYRNDAPGAEERLSHEARGLGGGRGLGRTKLRTSPWNKPYVHHRAH